MNFYLAGKVAGNKWKVVKPIKGPYQWVASDGGNHSEHEFGWGYFDLDECNHVYKQSIDDGFIRKIGSCLGLVAYLDTADSFGSIAEIAYASALMLPCLMLYTSKQQEDIHHCSSDGDSTFYRDKFFDSYWFVGSFPYVRVIYVKDEKTATLEIMKFIYPFYLKTKHWKIIREIKFKESFYKCETCGAKDNLNIHHRTYRNIGNEPMEDLICVCQGCHSEVHHVST